MVSVRRPLIQWTGVTGVDGRKFIECTLCNFLNRDPRRFLCDVRLSGSYDSLHNRVRADGRAKE